MVCSVEGCDRAVAARGWCGTHYQRWLRHGSIESTRRYSPGAPCEVGGCLMEAKARGWCQLHYSRWRVYGDPKGSGPGRGRGAWHGCRVCRHPQLEEINAELVNGTPFTTVAQMFNGIGIASVRRHIADHLPVPGRHSRCWACEHERIDDIDTMLELHHQVVAIVGPQVRGTLSIPNIAIRFGLSADVLRNHDSPEHQERRALYEMGRLAAVKEIA